MKRSHGSVHGASAPIVIAENAFRSGNIAYSESLLTNILASNPKHSKANELMAYIVGNRGNGELSFEFLKKATRVSGATAEAYYYLGTFYLSRQLHDEAIEAFHKSIRLSGEYFEVLHDLGVALAGKGQFEKSLLIFDKARVKNTNSYELFYNIGRSFEALHRYKDALASYERAIKINPNVASVWNNCGVALTNLKNEVEAVRAYDMAIKLDPRSARTWANRGVALTFVNRNEEALESFKHAIQIQPDIDYLYGNWVAAKMKLCDWDGIEDAFDHITRRIQLGEKVCMPFSLLSMPSQLSTQKQCSETHINDQYPEMAQPKFSVGLRTSGRIKIGYFSADFHNHATAYLMAELFELHDRSKFEIIAFSFGVDAKDEMRKRLVSAFDQFIDVSSLTDKEIAKLAGTEGIQIAVDLKGFTKEGLPGIFAYRAAPVQVSYLGYPGTMGAKYIDYLIADPTIIPPQHIEQYTERIAFLPDTYQVNDRTRKISEKTYTRSNWNLPEEGFIFACFNVTSKITPDVFNIWMNLLLKVPGSVLWLVEENRTAIANLRIEAGVRGVSEERLIFASRAELSEHLARIKLADLFLDTFYYTAHTTCSDALWAGLPVLTCMGQTFAGRVAASLLQAAGLPDLITYSHSEYECMALELANNQNKLKSLREQLEQAKATCKLFDTPLFTKNIEGIYLKMWERHRNGLAPDHIYAECR